METLPVLSVAERFYNNHKTRVTEYQKANPDKMRAKCKAYTTRLKDERPEIYQTVLEAKRKYYWEVTKPKKDAKKKEVELRASVNV
jgi:hypothetical protein